ncbi:MAG: nitroreductase family protein [Candidatus Bathyarchaeia archaeon]|jgi:nitroreductase
MDAYECVATKLEVREFEPRNVPADVKLKVLEAARLTGSGMNNQHWRFILVQGRDNLKRLAEDSTTGGWVAQANFAVIVLTNPKFGFHMLDAGRAAQDMQIAAWNSGVGSCLFTGLNLETLRKDFGIPNDLSPSVVVGFGYPAKKLTGKRKNRKPLSELASLSNYDSRLEPGKLQD